MRRSVLTLPIVLSFTFCCTQFAWAQPSDEKTAQPAATQAAQPATTTRPADDGKKAEAPADPSGSWKWEIDFGGNKSELILKLNWDGKTLDGKYTAFDNTTKVENGKVDKDGFSFVTKPDFGGNQFEIKFKGKVVKDEVKGTITLDFGMGAQENEWTAKRFLDTEDVVGVWEIETAGFDGNPFRSTLTITKDDKGLHGKTSSDFGDFELSKVEIKDNQLLYDISPPQQGDVAFKIANKVTPRGNNFEGVSIFDFNGNANEMKFTGKRRKEEKKAEPARPAADEKAAAKQAAPAATSDGK